MNGSCQAKLALEYAGEVSTATLASRALLFKFSALFLMIITVIRRIAVQDWVQLGQQEQLAEPCSEARLNVQRPQNSVWDMKLSARILGSA